MLFPSLITLLSLAGAATSAAAGGRWDLLNSSTGVSAMHMQLLREDDVVFFDRTDFGESGLPLPNGKCRDDPRDLALRHDCTAHAAEYNVASGSIRALMVLTDTWCSSGTVAPDGTLVQTGGFNDGECAVRKLLPGGDSDWEENPTALLVRRWYASNQLLPDGRAVIVGGRRQFSYEFYPPTGAATTFELPLLRQTRDGNTENNLYPFLHLNVDGNLFVFANNRSILFDYRRNAVVKSFPLMTGGGHRNYPSSGSSVLLPLEPSGTVAEVLVCGGAPAGSYEQALQEKFLRALDTCGRIRITDEKPVWSMETMPMARAMGDMILLPHGDVLIINGVSSGTAGWDLGRDPVLSPVTYLTNSTAPGSRFQVEEATTIPRLYHSSVVLLRDGRVLVGGSNPHRYYNFTGVKYPTETSLEAFSPGYLSPENRGLRPVIGAASPQELAYGEQFSVKFWVAAGLGDSEVRVTMALPSFTTHSFAMNQRLLVLETWNIILLNTGVEPPAYEVTAVAPRSPNVAPPGYYMLFVVNGKIPSEGIWVHIG